MAYELICRGIASGAQSSECASWVQAWGSIAAILVAVLVAWWQFHTARVTARQVRRDKALVMVEAIEALVQLFELEIVATNAYFEGASVESLELYFSGSDPALLFVTVERSIQAVPLHDLFDARAVNLVIAAQHQIRTARDVVVRISRDHQRLGEVGVKAFAKAFSRHASMAAELSASAAEAKIRAAKLI